METEEEIQKQLADIQQRIESDPTMFFLASVINEIREEQKKQQNDINNLMEFSQALNKTLRELVEKVFYQRRVNKVIPHFLKPIEIK